MSQFLPVGDFSFLKEKVMEETFPNFVIDVDDENDTGHILKVDIEYASCLHDEHNCLPLAPENIIIDESMYSPFQKEFPKQLPQTRLTPNLMKKIDYIVHYRNLKLYLKLGMKITKIHDVLSFTQKPWLAKYIQYNTDCRSKAKSLFEKNFYKLMNNAVFGKTNENLRNRVNVEIITDRKIALKRVAKTNFIRSQVIHEDLVIIQTAISTLKLNKPIYVGFTILDVSKILMYNFHYQHIKKKYDKGVQLCFSDTDSLLYEIKTEDIYKDMEEDKEMYDFSDYPKPHNLHSIINKKVIGKFKDELNGQPLEEFCGLRSKCYSLLYDCPDGCIIKAKGNKKSVKNKYFRHKHYVDCLLTLSTYSISQNLIKSKAHTVSSYNVKKTALTVFDLKRYICCDGIHTLAHGHYNAKGDKCLGECTHIV